MVAATCPRCTSVVALHEGRPFVTSRGVELWHAACWNNRDVPIVAATPEMPSEPVEIAVSPPPRRRRTPVVAVGGVTVLIGLIAMRAASGDHAIASSQVSVDVALDEVTYQRSVYAEREIAPPKPARVQTLEDRFPIPSLNDQPIDGVFTSLRGWVHPITSADELFPGNPGRHFGAERTGVERAECGGGHCGVDLDGPRGRALVSVAAGVLITVERRELGGDGRSGRFVRIQHDDGSLTSYMHMDAVDDRLQAGDRVRAGQYIGTLGDSAVPGAPHLHFALEVPRRVGSRDTIFAATRFIDPAPFLVRSVITEVAERRHAQKPAF
jgi:murein DD-endopeptidase MepM/ murein hydrolase activator NlpD